MRKYLVLFCFFLGMAIYVSVQDEHAAKNAAGNTGHDNQFTSSVKADKDQPQQNVSDAERNTPSCFSFFRWPNGTATWAIILTLFAIAEQTRETARAARATERAVHESAKQTEISRKTLIAQFRPQLRVRRILLKPPTVAEFDQRRHGTWEIEIHVYNGGGTPAHIESCEASAHLNGVEPNMVREDIGEQKWGECSIDRGNTHKFVLPIANPQQFRTQLRAAESAYEKFKTQRTFPTCQGFIAYRDDDGRSYDLAFDRDWHIEEQRFIPANDPESEYSD